MFISFFSSRLRLPQTTLLQSNSIPSALCWFENIFIPLSVPFCYAFPFMRSYFSVSTLIYYANIKEITHVCVRVFITRGEWSEILWDEKLNGFFNVGSELWKSLATGCRKNTKTRFYSRLENLCSTPAGGLESVSCSPLIPCHRRFPSWMNELEENS